MTHCAIPVRTLHWSSRVLLLILLLGLAAPEIPVWNGSDHQMVGEVVEDSVGSELEAEVERDLPQFDHPTEHGVWLKSRDLGNEGLTDRTSMDPMFHEVDTRPPLRSV